MAKKPSKKPAAKRGGAKKPAPVSKKTAASNRPKQRKPTKRMRDSTLPHVDVVPRHPTVEEQYRAEHAARFDPESFGAIGIDHQAGATLHNAAWPKPSLLRRALKRFRSAITGRWVSKLWAKRHPSTTVGERAE